MQKIYSDDQKHLLQSMDDLKNHPWWKIISNIIKARIDELDWYLLWKVEMKNPQTWFIENLDEVKYSTNKVLRAERIILDQLLSKPDEIIKHTWIIS